MASKTFSAGTVIDSAWLNDVNDATYGVNKYATLDAAIAANPAGLVFMAGTYNVTTNKTFTMPVEMKPGAILNISAGVTVAFNGGFSAGIYQVFSGSGTVTFDKAKIKAGYVEWWGALANTSSTSPINYPVVNLAAITAALVALGIVELLPADYFISNTLSHVYANTWLKGNGYAWDSTYGLKATRVIVTSASAHCFIAGSSVVGSAPPSQYVQGIKVTDISFTRDRAPTYNSGCTAVRVQYALEAFFEGVRGDESMQGWEFVNSVSCRMNRCVAKRTSAASGGTDSWKGFYINGSGTYFAGGNASLYFFQSHADDTRATKTNSVGFYADQAFTDLFLSWCETVTCTVGMQIVGNAAAGVSNANTDCRLDNCTNDAFGSYGLLIQNVNSAGSVEIIGGYQGPAAGAAAAIRISNSPACINILGGECVMNTAPTCKGIELDTVSGINLAGTMVQECATASGAVICSNITSCTIMPIVKNRTIVCNGPAVQLLNTCTDNYIAPTVFGQANGVTYGIQVVGTGDSRNEYNLTKIVSANCYGRKLDRNGTNITTTGLSGTNLVSGVTT